MAMHAATIIEAENKALRAANAKVVKKRAKKKSYVGQGGVLLASEVQASQNQVDIQVEVATEAIPEPYILAPTRALRMCSICRSLAHTACTCLER